MTTNQPVGGVAVLRALEAALEELRTSRWPADRNELIRSVIRHDSACRLVEARRPSVSVPEAPDYAWWPVKTTSHFRKGAARAFAAFCQSLLHGDDTESALAAARAVFDLPREPYYLAELPDTVTVPPAEWAGTWTEWIRPAWRSYTERWREEYLRSWVARMAAGVAAHDGIGRVRLKLPVATLDPRRWTPVLHAFLVGDVEVDADGHLLLDVPAATAERIIHNSTALGLGEPASIVAVAGSAQVAQIAARFWDQDNESLPEAIWNAALVTS